MQHRVVLLDIVVPKYSTLSIDNSQQHYKKSSKIGAGIISYIEIAATSKNDD